MKTITFITFILISVSGYSASRNHFFFNNENINSLIGFICVGEENIATLQTGGGIEDERVSVSNWNIVNSGDEIVVKGHCNASILKDGDSYELGDGYDLEMTFYPNDIKDKSGLHTSKGTVGNAAIEIKFKTETDIIDGKLTEKTTVQSLAIAGGIGGARASFGAQIIDYLFSDLFAINSKNSTMTFCNHSAKLCKKSTWKIPGGTNLSYKATGLGWLMNFGVKKINNNLFFNAAKIINTGGPYRIPNFQCLNNSGCGGTVLLNAGASYVNSCSKYMEKSSALMTVSICKDLVNKLGL